MADGKVMSKKLTKVLNKQLEQEYIEMAKDEEREKEAYEWIEGCIGDIHEEK